MYESHFNLTGDPFGLRPNKRKCYVHQSYRKAQSYLLYAVQRGEGLLLVTGEPGTGKTSLVRDCVRQYTERNVKFIELSLGKLNADDLVYLTAHKLGSLTPGMQPIERITALETKLQELADSGTRVLVVIDEAQSITDEALEEIKNLSNMEYENAPLLQFFLVGQKSLRERLQNPAMSQVMQRVTAACELEPMDKSEFSGYVTHCLTECGWNGSPLIDDLAMDVLFDNSGGVPRKVNLIASRLLLRGMVEDLRSICAEDTEEVVNNLQCEGLLA